MRNAPVRFAIVGAGAISQAYIQAFEGCERTELIAVCDSRPDVANAVADANGVVGFTSLKELMQQCQPDAAIVCTPPVTHPEICIALLESGVHVLCEKPLAISSTEAIQMIETAERCDRQFSMASKFRCVEDVAQAKSMVETGKIGDLVLVENTFTGQVDMASRWNSNPQVSGGGVLIDNGTHSVDLMRYFLGPISQLQVVEGKRVQDLQVEDSVRLFLKNHDDVMGSVDLSWSLHKPLPSFLDVYGTGGTIMVGWKESRFRLAGDADWTVFGTGYDKIAAFQRQLANFAGAIQGQESLLLRSRDALDSVQLIEAAYLSLRENRWLEVESLSAQLGSA